MRRDPMEHTATQQAEEGDTPNSGPAPGDDGWGHGGAGGYTPERHGELGAVASTADLIFGSLSERSQRLTDHLERWLPHTPIDHRPHVYLSIAYLATAVAFLVTGFLASAIYDLSMAGLLPAAMGDRGLLLVLQLLVGPSVMIGMLAYPVARARPRLVPADELEPLET